MDKFDLSWFLTIEGLCISAGVVCLLIAIIVLVISNVRDKKEKNLLAAVDNNQVPADANNNVPVPQVPADVNNQVAAAPVAVEQTPVVPVSVPPVDVAPVETVAPQVDVMPIATDMVQTPVAPVETSVDVAPVAQAVEMPITVEAPMIDVQPVEVAPVEVAAPVTEELVQESVAVEMPVTVEAPVVEAAPVEAVQPVEVMQQVETLANPTVPMVEAAPVEVAQPVEVMQPADTQVATEVQPVIYGGASLGVSNLDLNQNPTHQIYGGANPLENTQSMPIMNDFNQAPAAPVEVAQPMMEAVPAAPVEMVQQVETQVVSSTPVMEPIA